MDEGYPDPPVNATVMEFAPDARNGILVVAEATEDISNDPLDVTVLSVEFKMVVLEPVPIVKAVVHEDVEIVTVADVERLVIRVNVG